MRTIRTYKLRRSRITPLQEEALLTHAPAYLLDPELSPINLAHSLHRKYFVVEVGFGMGEATWQLAERQPDTAVLALDLHTPGIGRLVAYLHEHTIDNVKILEADAISVLEEKIQNDSVDALRLFFPDPWPKKRHIKRRFISAENLDLLASKIKVGGSLHIATDWDDYAVMSEELITVHSQWKLVSQSELCNPEQRPKTKFEMRGIADGRRITDLVAERV